MSRHFPPIIDISPAERAQTHREIDAACRDSGVFQIAGHVFNPVYSAEYAPLPSTVDSRRPSRYRPIQWREFRARRSSRALGVGLPLRP